MKTGFFHAYILEQLDAAEKQLCSYGQSGNPEALHQLRVAIKKIKAVCYFIGHLVEQRINISDLKEVFDRAGAVRELQIITQFVLSTAPENKELISELQNELSVLDDRFTRSIPSLIVFLQNFKTKLPPFIDLPGKRKTVESFIHLLEKAKSKLHHDREQLHRFRTAIKRIMNIYEALPENIKDDIEVDREVMDQQQKSLGHWHDSFAAKDYLANKLHLPASSPVMELLNALESRAFKACHLHKIKVSLKSAINSN